MAGLVPGLPPAFDGVVRRALEKEPGDRYARAGDLGEAALAAVAEPAAARGEPAEPVTRRSQPPRRRLLIASMVALVAAAAVAGAVLAVSGSGSGSGSVSADDASSVLARYQAALTNRDIRALDDILAPGFSASCWPTRPWRARPRSRTTQRRSPRAAARRATR